MSTVVYKWWHLADCKLLQLIKQQKMHLVNKRASVTNFLSEKQQMALVECHSVYTKQMTFKLQNNKSQNTYTCITGEGGGRKFVC